MTTTRNMQHQRSSREKYLPGRWDGAAKTEVVGSVLLGWPYPSRALCSALGTSFTPMVKFGRGWNLTDEEKDSFAQQFG